MAASVFGATAPSNKVQIAIIGCGRIGTTMDIAGMAQNEDIAMLTSVCDVDAVRLASMKVTAEAFYRHKMDHLKLERRSNIRNDVGANEKRERQ